MISRPHRLFRLTLALALVLVLGGCQTIAEKQQSTRLEKTLHSYELTLRWGDPRGIDDYAAAYRGRQPAVVDHPEAIRVIGYEVLSGPTAIDDVTVVQQVLIRYVVRDTQVQKQVLDRQLWRYFPERKAWKRVSDAPGFSL